MPRKIKRRRRETPVYGELDFGKDGIPVSFQPVNGVAFRIRDAAIVERLCREGVLSPGDYEQAILSYQNKGRN